VRNKPKELLLSAILIPNQSIAQGYESYVAEMKSGVIGPQTYDHTPP
jgi:hypothetical protein